MPICHCPECIHCGAHLFLQLLLSPALASGNYVCRVAGLLDVVTDDPLAEACFPDGVLHGGDLFGGKMYLGMAGCAPVCSSSLSPELSVDESE